MKNKLKFLLFLFGLFLIIIGIRFLYLSQAKKEGRLQITSSPITNVLINGKPAGRTPFETPLPEGEVLIKLVPDAQEGTASASWTGKVRIPHNTRTFVSRELGSSDMFSSGVILTIDPMKDKPEKKNTGSIDVRTKPDGAIVYLDDEEQGISPLLLTNVPEGDHELSVKSPGFFRRSQKINIVEGYSTTAHFQLSLDPAHKKIDLEKKLQEASDSATLATPSGTLTPGLTLTPTLSNKKRIEVLQTDTGWLRVRSAPATSASESAKVNPGDVFDVLEEKSGWLLIEYIKGKTGWISASYTRTAVQ